MHYLASHIPADRVRIHGIPVWGTHIPPEVEVTQPCPITVLKQHLEELPSGKLEGAMRFALEQLHAAGMRLQVTASDTIYRLGIQPEHLDDGSDRPVESHLLWQQFVNSGNTHQTGDLDLSSEQTWVIANLKYEFRLRTLAHAFRPTAIEHVMILPLRHRSQTLGSLSIFRTATQSRWTLAQVRLAQEFSQAFAQTLYQHQLTQDVHHLNQTLIDRTHDLEEIIDYQATLSSVVNKIRASIDLNTIFSTTVEEIYHQLNADRVVVYRFNPDWSGEFLAEAIGPAWTPLKIAQAQPQQEHLTCPDHCIVQSFLDAPVSNVDPYLQTEQGGTYRQSRRAKQVNDIYAKNFPDCYLEVLEAYECRAYLIAPIYLGKNLWGLLGIYQNQAPRQWRTQEISLTEQIAEQLGIAIQQAELLKTQQEQAETLSATLHELTRTQTQMLQTEKMSSLGQLTAGLSHEINNPVTFIHSNLSHLGQYLQDLMGAIALYQQYHADPHPAIQAYLEQIDLAFLQADLPKVLNSMAHGTQRISDVMTSLQNFAHLDEEGIKRLDLHEGLDSVLLILQHQCHSRDGQSEIQIHKQYSDLPAVECDGSLMNQVFMNLLGNAIEALQERDQHRSRSEITLQPSRIDIQTTTCELVDYPAVCIRIQDNGPGIPETIQHHIFEPFFTTKDVGQGSGLGLSISHHIIVDNHQGHLTCTSAPDCGTTFEIVIPVNVKATCELAVAKPAAGKFSMANPMINSYATPHHSADANATAS